MGLMDFIKKQFIDIIQWTEEGDGTLAWRFPMRDMEIQYGASLTVRESQMAVFVNEGKVADVFGPGTHKLTTQTIPVLTYLKNWDKLFESPFKSDVYFFSTRQQIDQKWGTPQPVTIRDKDFGAVRLRAFGNYSFRIADPKLFHAKFRARAKATPWPIWTASCAGWCCNTCRTPSRKAASRSWTWRPTRLNLPRHVTARTGAGLGQAMGLKLEGMTVQNVSLPEELQKILDQKIGMGMVGNDMGKFMQYQTAQAIPKFAEGAAGVAAALRAMPWAGCRRGAGPGAGAEPAAGPAGRGGGRRWYEARRSHGHPGKAGRPQGQGHPDRGRVQCQEG
jgi:membrane protease subunit (stomatin/prohibitin family)